MSRDGSATRKKIVDAAWALLESGNAPGVRMSDIAKRAGVSRQALYLHFPTRADLLIATTRYLDEVKDVDALLAPSRNATTGKERLDAFVTAWGNYIPEIYGVGRALMAMMDHDAEARAAWMDRMQALREGCAAAVAALARDGDLAGDLDQEDATDMLWAALSVRVWEQLRHDCGWSQTQYVDRMLRTVRKMLLPT